jgi:hypothetical protein
LNFHSSAKAISSYAEEYYVSNETLTFIGVTTMHTITNAIQNAREILPIYFVLFGVMLVSFGALLLAAVAVLRGGCS